MSDQSNSAAGGYRGLIPNFNCAHGDILGSCPRCAEAIYWNRKREREDYESLRAAPAEEKTNGQ